MEYIKGKIGRVFLLKFEDDDILIDKLSYLAKKEKIKSAAFMFIGALKKGHLVTGPKLPVIPPEPNWVTFRDGWEVMGSGTIFSGKTGPQIHVHATMGKKNKVLTGCVRKDSKVFLVIEAIVYELMVPGAAKQIDAKTGINMLKIKKRG